jgi:general secretion pathway protein J
MKGCADTHIHHGQRCGTRSGGFTLLELLVVMVLLSVIMVAMGSAMRAVAQSEERIDQKLLRSDEFRVSTHFIRVILGRVSDTKVAVAAEPNASSVMFSGNANTVAWVGVMPARYGVGGRNFFRLGIESVENSSALVLRFVPWTDASVFPEWSQADARVLVADVSALSVRYEDTSRGESVWVSEWPYLDKIPQRLDMAIQTTEGSWPNLIVAMRAMSPSYNSGGIVIGGSE